MELHDYFQELRKNKGTKLSVLEAATKVSKSSISKYLNGASQPRAGFWKKLAEHYGVRLEDVEKEVADFKKTNFEHLTIGFTHTILAAPLIYIIASSTFNKASLTSHLDKKNNLQYYKASHSLKKIASNDFNSLKLNNPDTKRPQILSDNRIKNLLLNETLDCVATTRAIMEREDHIKGIASMSFGIEGVVKPIILGPTNYIKELSGKKENTKESFTFEDIKGVFKAESDFDINKIELFFVNNHLSASLYQSYYFKESQDNINIEFCEHAENIEVLLNEVLCIMQGTDRCLIKHEFVITELVQEIIKRKCLVFIMYSHPHLHWIEEQFKGHDEVSTVIYELSDLFPERQDPLISFNLYVKEGFRNLTKKKELFYDLFDSLSTAITDLNSLKETDEENELTYKRHVIIEQMAKYLGMDKVQFLKVLKKINFQLYYDHYWVSYLKHSASMKKPKI